MKPILCVTEFDDLTVEAAKVAAAFARRLGERVVLVRSVDEREQFSFHLRSRLLQHDWRRLAREAQQLRQRGFDFDEKVVLGMPEEGIAGFAWRTAASLIVVGSRPTATLEHWALGCIAEEICDTSLVPVLAVRSAAPFESWLERDETLHVLAAFDPAARPDAMFHRLDELRQLGPCTITAAFVPYPENKGETSPAPPPDPNRHPFDMQTSFPEAMTHELEARGIAITRTRASSDCAGELVHAASEHAADLLVIESHPETDLALLPHPVLSHRVLCRAPMNVLCVPEPAIEPPRILANSEDTRNSANRYAGNGAQVGGDGRARP